VAQENAERTLRTPAAECCACGVTFRYKQAFADGSKPVEYGLIAEEVAEVYPDMVVRSADGQIETVKYQDLARQCC
jgi:hypothetical protein